MKRTDALVANKLCSVVERFGFHSQKAKSENPIVSDIAQKMCEIELWELWVLTQDA